MNNANTEGVLFLLVVVFQLLFLRLASISSFNISGKLYEYNFNNIVYIALLILSFLIYIILYSFLKKQITTNKISHRIYNTMYFLMFGFSLHFLYNMYCNETKAMPFGHFLVHSFVREHANHFLFSLFMSIVVIGLIIIILLSEKKILGKIRMYYAFFFSSLGAMFAYAPNIFQYDRWELWHMHAYINSIINVMHLIPYSDVNSSIYGHYGLIYYLFVKLFGSNLNAISITIALFTGITYLASFYVINKLVKNDLLFITSTISVLAMSCTYFGAGPYFQGMPHRCLFPMLTIAFITWRHYNTCSQKLLYLKELLFGVISIVFNLETGVCCVGIIVIYDLLSQWRKPLKDNLFLFAKSAFLIVSCIVLAYLFVNFYNITLEGEWNSINTFIYPFASESYHVFSDLRLPIPPPETPYFLYVVVFSYAAFSSLKNIIFEKKQQYLDIEKLIIAISGLSSLFYFINRTAPGNLFISHIQLVILLSVFADTFVSINKQIVYNNLSHKTLKVLASFLSIFLIGWFAIEGMISIGNVITYREKGVWDTNSFNKDINDFSNWVPENAVAFGMGVPELYYTLGLNTHIYITDWSDMNKFSLSKLNDVLLQSNEVIVSEHSIKIFKSIPLMIRKNGYNEKRRFIGNNFTLIHYQKAN